MREAACLGDRVFIFTGRPGQIRSELKIDLPRPRDLNDPKVAEYAQVLMKELEDDSSEEKAASLHPQLPTLT
jgi:NitT/TauT family transport system ATP-binding protein